MAVIDFDIPSLHDGYRGGLDPVRVVEEVYHRLEAAADPGIFISLVAQDSARRRALSLGSFDADEKPLWGVPFAVKDNIDAAGLPTTAACPAFAYEPAASASCVERLLDAGAILIGKTNLDQFAAGLVGLCTPFAAPKNVIDPTLVPGGSSSGSAVAVARAIVSFALGTDTAGSGRVPAALNNIVGLKPSPGAVSTRGVVPACRSLDCVSVLALSVEDAWRVFKIIAGADGQDPYSRPLAIGEPSLPPVARVGVPSIRSREFFADRHAQNAYEAALADLEQLGVKLIEFEFDPLRQAGELLYGGAWVAERYQAIRGFFDQHPDALHPVTREIIGAAKSLSAHDAFAGMYKLAELKRASESLWRRFDMIAVPSVPTVYTVAEVEAAPIALNSRFGVYTNFVNLLDLAALAVPGRARADGWPAGVTLIGPRGSDGLLAGLGSRLHRISQTPVGATGRVLSPLARVATGAPPGWIEIAVVGAHLSALPLNHELTEKGAMFVRAGRTAADYKLFALAGGPPKRPGLLRVSPGEGSSIECEVWALEAEGFGRFVAAVAAPLTIGTLELADGTSAKGFLVEAEATRSARDISRFGGWRAYLTDAAERLAPR